MTYIHICFVYIIVKRNFMTDEINKSDRKLAAYFARKYFSGQISKYNLLHNFPSFENDYKIRELFQKIESKSKTVWLFGVSKSKYEKFLKETYEIIDELESEKNAI